MSNTSLKINNMDTVSLEFSLSKKTSLKQLKDSVFKVATLMGYTVEQFEAEFGEINTVSGEDKNQLKLFDDDPQILFG